MARDPMTREAAALYFWTRVDQSGGPNACHPWKGVPMNTGYGQFNSAAFGWMTAHTLAYELAYGEIPFDESIGRKYDVDHECHNRDASCRGGRTCKHRRCCNPKHLKVRTTGENKMEADRERGRGIFTEQCPKNHPYDEENTGWTKRTVRGVTKSERYCKACNRDKAYKAKTGSERPADAMESMSRAGCPTCARGHAYDEQNTVYTATTGKRRCRKCERLNDLKSKWKKKTGITLVWYSVEDIAKWHQGGDDLEKLWFHGWQTGNFDPEYPQEKLTALLDEAGGVLPQYALEAWRHLDGSTELRDGVHRWGVARELGITQLLVYVRTYSEAGFAYP